VCKVLRVGISETLERCLVVTSGKGGVGKTSVAVNVAGEAAAGGLRALLIDLDPSGGTAGRLGLKGDRGEGLARSISTGEALAPVEARPGLDWVPGGIELNRFRDNTVVDARAAFQAAVATVANGYDLVVVDTPPGNVAQQELGLAVARYVVAPVTGEPDSWGSLAATAPLVADARSVNPALEWLGLVLVKLSAGQTRMLSRTRENLAEIAAEVPFFVTRVRNVEAAAAEMSYRGQLARELAGRLAEDRSEVLAALAARRAAVRGGGNAPALPDRVPESVAGLAADYAQLTEEIVTRIIDRERGRQ